MSKPLLIVLGIFVVVVIGFFAFNQYIYQEKQGPLGGSQSQATDTKALLDVTPVSHASMVINVGGQVIYNDPVGTEGFTGLAAPTIILLSDIHGDHLNPETLLAVSTPETVIVAPQAVSDMLPDNLQGTIIVLANGETTTQKGIGIEAVPMYNVPESKDARHIRGRGNGYILSAESKRIYIAGDTGPTAEMIGLENIDAAFIPMNPPFTMTVEEAADAVLAFKPKTVYPYHYRTQSGLSDIEKFKTLVNNGDSDIQVQLLDFYPE